MARFEVGQKVIFTSDARERAGFSREVNAVVKEVHYPLKGRPPMYTISWPSTGCATVLEREIREERFMSFGMKVRLWHILEGKMVLENLRNVTEIHYNYRRRYPKFGVAGSGWEAGPGEVMIAFESDIHGTGITYRLATVVEFDAVLETEKAESF